jgi:hypothetical protein
MSIFTKLRPIKMPRARKVARTKATKPKASAGGHKKHRKGR